MADIWNINGTAWYWNWTEFCGVQGSIRPLNPVTHDLGVCFQQLYLQIPVLALLAVISAYYCGKRDATLSREERSFTAINIRLAVTACLAVLPIIRAYIILSNTTLTSSNVNDAAVSFKINHTVLTSNGGTDFFFNGGEVARKINKELNYTRNFTKSLFSDDIDTRNLTERSTPPPRAKIAEYDILKLRNMEMSAKPIDYLVAGTEGLAWVVHFCFVLSLRRGNVTNPRGPISIRTLVFLLIGISVLLLRSHVNHKTQDDVVPNLSLGFSISVVTLLILYIVTLIPGGTARDFTRRQSRQDQIGERTALLNTPNSSYIRFLEERDPCYLGPAMEDATLTSKLLFHWVTPLMEKGVRGLLNHSDDLYDLPEHISTTVISHEIERHIQTMSLPQQRASDIPRTSDAEIAEPQVVSSIRISLFRLLHKCFGWQFYAVGILKFIADFTGFMGPMLLNKLVGFVEDKNEPISYGYMYAALMLLSTLVGAFCNVHFSFWMSVVGLKIRATIVTLVYRKTLHSSNVNLNKHFTFGEIVNFISTDSERIVNSSPSFHALWSIPLQVVVTLYLLYNQIGIAFLAGVSFAIILIPINKVVAQKIGVLSTKLMEFKDQRVRLVGEALRGVTTIRLNVWEDHFLRNILKLRENEIKHLRSRKYLDALCVYFWATTPVLISLLTFGTYVLLDHELDAKTVFTSMALLNMLIGPLNVFPWVLNGLTEAWVSLKRIQRLIDLPDLDTSTYYADPPIGVDVMLKNVTLSVNSGKDHGSLSGSEINDAPTSSSECKRNDRFEDENKFSLKDLSVSVQKGQLIGIMGKVGSGKSLLLDGILAEVTKEKGVVAVQSLDKGFGYVKQNPWLQRGTIRDNILFGKAYDQNKYKSILKACALVEDLNSLPMRDLTSVGEAGNTLSGGQKARIALARAVYADKDIYVLDDILATLDTNVAKHVFQNVIQGLLEHKTRIMCTHQTKYLIHADWILDIANGRVINQGKPGDILPNIEEFLLFSESIEASQSDVNAASKVFQMEFNEIDHIDGDSALGEELMEKGTVHHGVYMSYLKSIGYYLAISIFLSMVLMQSSKNITDLWLSYWVTHANITVNNSDVSHFLELQYFYDNYRESGVGYYLTVYAILALFNSAFTLIRAFIFAYGGIQAATVMHKQLLKVIMKAKMIFFDIQPLGRVLNRFSSDTYTVDDTLPFIANILLATLFGLIGSIVVMAYGLPWIFLILTPLVPVYHWLQYHYRLTSRELKRLSSVALSPVYTHFNETMQGLGTIRAFRAVSRFKRESELFLEASQKTQFASMAAAQWLALRLQFIGVALVVGVCFIAVLQHQYNIADPGFIGLTMVYTLSICELLSGVINAFTETEREMIAVERVRQYLEHTPIENPGGDSPPYAWPSQGVVEFKDVVLKYRDHLAPSLAGVSFVTRPAEKIGIVGRTGAGKSSLFASLFRLTEITSGKILIDNVDVQSLRLNALRSRLCIIPQNPFLFSGTIRDNVDPLNQYPDSQVYKALEKCKVHTLVSRMGGLGAILEEGGSNLSAGQRQLFCLVRAVLHNAKILCIDEATANVDQETDKYIQTTIKSSFRSATVITIAHRIRTIMHCDRVIVMGDGKVLEYDEPDLLIQDTGSYFHNLASQEFSDHE